METEVMERFELKEGYGVEIWCRQYHFINHLRHSVITLQQKFWMASEYASEMKRAKDPERLGLTTWKQK